MGETNACIRPAALLADPEPMPEWIVGEQEPKRLLAALLASRTVFYPGSGTDGQPTKLFGGAHAAHSFVYADYGHSLTEIRGELQSGMRGYHPCFECSFRRDQLVDAIGVDLGHGPPEFYEFLGQHAQNYNPLFGDDPPADLGAGLAVILQREEGFTATHGPPRLAYLHLFAEACLVYWALWGRHFRPEARGPYAIVLQDHGCGGNWTTFGGRRSLLYALAHTSGLPKWLLVADNTEPWPGYRIVPGWSGIGGMGRHARRLNRRSQGGWSTMACR